MRFRLERDLQCFRVLTSFRIFSKSAREMRCILRRDETFCALVHDGTNLLRFHGLLSVEIILDQEIEVNERGVEVD